MKNDCDVSSTLRSSGTRVLLTSEDGDFYSSVAANFSSMAEERRARRARNQRAYRRHRDARLEVDPNVRSRLSYVG
ncbi:hypothetical protein Pcac1_g25694 [Phytophthora cactorum]|nr:hypothetical protein Pcac1_g25694 [Phytophthora cactorum]KAG2806778.1 hypothetical protein PC112_g17702 [Phytophthora cactorum]KAG2912757.1 hypothetical protein PC117_g18799 [Phytophthora cactorum]KAG2969630.1 hypothetical protein PC118_g17340 [Phytophthora cactorum]KAG2989019.1 hypothetical protein PC120_g23256 [Phytophthora cactorum]